MEEIKDLFDDVSAKVNAELEWLIPDSGPGPASLRDAMRWSLFAGGKHFRPMLVFAVGRSLGAADEQLVRTAAAIEMIHTYSLIHDDLPSMDDDDLRRGRETCHVKFGEATAILAGDALQVLAFQAIAEDAKLSEETRVELLRGLSQAAARMVVGQQLDLEAEGRDLTLDEVDQIHVNKTGALIGFAARAGASIAQVSDELAEDVSAYGEKLGLLFQVTDDLLDVTQPTEKLGKTAGKDLTSEKATYPSIMGIDATNQKIAELLDDIHDLVNRRFSKNSALKQIAEYLAARSN
jgi:geranylgeranyl pyrophosphate synthase